MVYLIPYKAYLLLILVLMRLELQAEWICVQVFIIITSAVLKPTNQTKYEVRF